MENTKKSRRKSGLIYGGLSDILDASVLLNDCWAKISHETIIKCWIRSNISFGRIVANLENMIELDNKDKEDNLEIEKIFAELENAHLTQINEIITSKKNEIVLKHTLRVKGLVKWMSSSMINLLENGRRTLKY